MAADQGDAEALRSNFRRVAMDRRVIDRLVALAEEGMQSGIANDFDIDIFVKEMRVGD